MDETQALNTTVGAEAGAIPPEELDRLTDDIVSAMKTVYDPEIPVDIYELGLIYRVDIDDDRRIAIDMTLTSPSCPRRPNCQAWSKARSGRCPASPRSRST